MTRGIERALRAGAILIALLGLVDPALTLPWRDRPIVSVMIAPPSPREDRSTMEPALGPDEGRDLQAKVVAALAGEVDARAGPVDTPAAIVLVGDGRSPALPSLPAGTVVSAVIGSPAASAVRIARVDAPRRAHISARLPIGVQIEARGLAGRTSTVVVRSDGLDLARQTHTWPAAATSAARTASATITLSPLPLRTGPTRLTIDILDDAHARTDAPQALPAAEGTIDVSTPPALATADVMVDVHDDPLRVLFFDARPSWATRFIRRALEDDRRFAVSALARVSRGLTASSSDAPSSLAAANLDALHAIVVGAPELLTAAEIDRLRAFARARGGLVVIAPDQRPEGPMLTLLPARDFTERLLNDAATLDTNDRHDRASETTTRATTPATSTTSTTAATPTTSATLATPTAPTTLTTPTTNSQTPSLPTTTPATSATSATSATPTTPTTPTTPATPATTTATMTKATLTASEIVAAKTLLPGATILLGLPRLGSPDGASDDAVRRDDRGESHGDDRGESRGRPAAARAPSANAGGDADRRAQRSEPVVIESPLGEGVLIFSGALDAWRFRARDDAAFDRFWRETIAARAAAVPDPIEVRLDPAIAAPGDPIAVSVRVRTAAASDRAATTALSSAATTRAATPTPAAAVTTPATRETPPASAATAGHTVTVTTAATVTATVATTVAPVAPVAPAAAATAQPTSGAPIRLWPGTRPSAYHGALNAPSGDGVYAVSVQADDEQTDGVRIDGASRTGSTTPGRATGHALFLVAPGVRTTRPTWPGLQAFVEARGGLLVTADHLDILARHLRDTVRPADARRARHPLRSAWWIVPFVACLGGEWFLRRRRGER